MTAYTDEQEAHIASLFEGIEGSMTPMAVVDYEGKRDGDGLVDFETPLGRRFGTRDMGHVYGYGLRTVRRNKAAQDRVLDERTDLAFPLRLVRGPRPGRFAVEYGVQVHKNLTYAEAARHYGESLLHALGCAGKLER